MISKDLEKLISARKVLKFLWMVKEGSGRECISRGILAKQAAVIKVGSKSFDQKEGRD